MNKPKVLIVYHYFAHYRLPILRELTRNNKYNFRFVSGKTSEITIEKISPELIEKNTDSDGLNWEFVENIWIRSGPLLWQKGLIKKCLLSDYDSIIFLGSPYFISTWIAVLIARFKGKKVLFWTHGFIRNEGLKDVLRKLFFKTANGLLLYSNWAKLNLTQHGFKPENLTVINNSLDYEKHITLRYLLSNENLIKNKKALFSEYDLPIVMFVGRLTPQKKLTVLLELVTKLNASCMEVNLLLIGDGEARLELETAVKRLNIQQNVVFYGSTHNEEELAPLIGMADICIAPGEVGLTAIHSMSYGTPVITHNDPLHQMPEFEAVIEGVTGSLFVKDDLNSLVKVTKHWLLVNRDRELVRQNCYKVVDQFYNPSYQVKKIIEALK